jgi:hypothetical protein
VCLVVVWFLELITRSDSQADNGQAKEKAAAAAKEQAAKKAAAEEKAAAAAKKAAADKAAEEANKADNAAAEPVHIGGATGSNAANINGIYDPTSELSCGRRVYKRRDADIWIELFGGKWQVKPASGKGKDNCWAFFAASRALEQCVGSTWQVYDGKAWAVQARVKLMPESRAAFELVHRPFSEFCDFPSGSEPQRLTAHRCFGLHISSDFRWISIVQYGYPNFRFSTETLAQCPWPRSSGWHRDEFFSATNKFYVHELYGPRTSVIYESESCSVVLETPEKIHCLSPDEIFVFCSKKADSKKWDCKEHDFKVLTLTGAVVWQFRLSSEVLFATCLPDNDTFIVLHLTSREQAGDGRKPDSTISKYSLSRRSSIGSVMYPGRFPIERLNLSSDGRWISCCHVVVNTQTLDFTELPLREPQKEEHYENSVFFLPGSQTAILDGQVFSCSSGTWIRRFAPKPDAQILRFVLCRNNTYLVTSAGRPEFFFENLSFACYKDDEVSYPYYDTGVLHRQVS